MNDYEKAQWELRTCDKWCYDAVEAFMAMMKTSGIEFSEHDLWNARATISDLVSDVTGGAISKANEVLAYSRNPDYEHSTHHGQP